MVFSFYSEKVNKGIGIENIHYLNDGLWHMKTYKWASEGMHLAKYRYCVVSVFVSVCDSMKTIPLWLCWINSTDAKILLASKIILIFLKVKLKLGSKPGH